MNKRAELASNWPMLVAAFVGIMLSATMLPFYVLGPLMKPLQAQLGWPRSGISASLSALAAGVTIGTFVAGKLIERVPARLIAVASMLAYAASFALFAWAGRDLWQFQALYFVVGIVGAGCGPLTYTKAIGATFVHARGIALGVALSGAGAAGSIGPLLIQAVNNAAGWRAACGAVAALVVLIGIPVVYYGLKERAPPSGTDTSVVEEAAAVGPAAASGAQIARDPRFHLLLVIIVVFGLVIGSLIIHLVPMMIDGGMPATRAAQVASLLGVMAFTGRLVVGWLLDRFSSTGIGAALFLAGAAGAAALAFGELGYAALSVIAFGLVTGAELDLLSFITLRYFGVPSYGKVYGWLFSAYTAVSIVGPFIASAVIDRTGYRGFYTAVCAVFIAIAGLYLLLGRQSAPLVPELKSGPRA
jgi:MFS family permease